MHKADLEAIQLLKKTEPFVGLRVRVSDSEEYKFKILGRGEMAFYQQNDRALFLEIDPRGGIFEKSIRRWDDGKKVTPEEKKVIIERVTAFFRSRGIEDVRVV
jgi:hypothetical protein